MIRSLGNKNIIVGIDPWYPYQGETAYQAYTRIIHDDVRSENSMDEIKTNAPDLIIGIGCPPQVNQYMVKNFEMLGLRRCGMIVLITDFKVNDSGDFLTFHGENGIDENIYVYESE